jgi:hypothetical protein
LLVAAAESASNPGASSNGILKKLSADLSSNLDTTIEVETVWYSGSGVGSILYGSVMLWKVTVRGLLAIKPSGSSMIESITILWHLHPYIVFFEGIPVSVEAAQSRLVHGSILLVPKHYSIAWVAFSRSLPTLSANRLDFIAL